MADRYVLMPGVDKHLWESGDWWVVDTSLPADHPKKIVSAHSQKEAAESTVVYQNAVNNG